MINSKIFQEQLEKVTPEIKKEMDWSAVIVKRIEQILKEKGITQRELASRIGCNETQIVRWTRGFPNYTLSTLAKLSEALGEDLICMSPVLPAVSGYHPGTMTAMQYLSDTDSPSYGSSEIPDKTSQ
ncbi:MAG: helix-turn-helix transcriptional regulator [Bacteroidales bacterium]|nr:helix-turn-helix transcriptional regulator [Bacteroidales bacterium]